MTLDTGSVNPLDSSILNIPSLANITLRKNAQTFSYSSNKNLEVTGLVNVGANGKIELASIGNFVNLYAGNPFTAGGGTKILTRDFFTYPQSAGVPGLSPVYGVTSFSQLGANQIGVALPLMGGSAAPFITEFTTGTGQPYILAKQAAILGVQLPPVIIGEGGSGRAITYTDEELEMLSPSERTNYESQKRQRAARVILQRTSGQSEEIGVPVEGQIPQAALPVAPAETKPTAKNQPRGKPMASGDLRLDKRGATQLLRARPNKALVLRQDSEAQSVLESERMAAEVSIESAPIANSK